MAAHPKDGVMPDSDPTPTPADPSAPTTPTPTDPAPPVPPEPQDGGDVEQLKRALAAERKAHREAEAARKAASTELEQLRQASMSEAEKAIEAARREGETAAETRLRDRLVTAEVRALASVQTIDPDLVAQLIPRDALKWSGDDLDRESVEKAIAKVLAAKPYLAASAGAPPAVPQVPAGARGTPSTGSITRADLQRMTPEQITAAYERGELAHLMTGP